MTGAHGASACTEPRDRNARRPSQGIGTIVEVVVGGFVDRVVEGTRPDAVVGATVVGATVVADAGGVDGTVVAGDVVVGGCFVVDVVAAGAEVTDG